MMGGLCITILVSVVFNSWKAQIASAASSCQGANFYFVGTGDDVGVNVIATSVDLNSNEPTLCSGSASWSDSAVWTLISSPHNCGYAQSGYFKTPNLTIKIFGEYNQDDCQFQNNWASVVFGNAQAGTHTYQVKYNSNKLNASMWFDNYRITKTPFDPGAKWALKIGIENGMARLMIMAMTSPALQRVQLILRIFSFNLAKAAVGPLLEYQRRQIICPLVMALPKIPVHHFIFGQSEPV
jgi:hypothetical protein